MSRNFCKIFPFFICISFFGSTAHIYGANDFCNHCKSVAHNSDEEPCLKCGRLVKDCDYQHTIKDNELTYEQIINAPNSNALIDILLIIKNMCKSTYGSNVSLHEIFKEGHDILEKNGIVLPESGFQKLKHTIKMRDYNENVRLSFNGQDNLRLDEFFDIDLLDESMSLAYSISNEEVEFPEKLRYGILLTLCGTGLNAVSYGTLAPFAATITSIGVGMSIDGYLEYNRNKEMHAAQMAEQERLKAEKEERKHQELIAKQERKRQKAAAKAEMRRQEEEKERQHAAEKAERKRQKAEAKAERRRQEEEKERQHAAEKAERKRQKAEAKAERRRQKEERRRQEAAEKAERRRLKEERRKYRG